MFPLLKRHDLNSVSIPLPRFGERGRLLLLKQIWKESVIEQMAPC